MNFHFFLLFFLIKSDLIEKTCPSNTIRSLQRQFYYFDINKEEKNSSSGKFEYFFKEIVIEINFLKIYFDMSGHFYVIQ